MFLDPKTVVGAIGKSLKLRITGPVLDVLDQGPFFFINQVLDGIGSSSLFLVGGSIWNHWPNPFCVVGFLMVCGKRRKHARNNWWTNSALEVKSIMKGQFPSKLSTIAHSQLPVGSEQLKKIENRKDNILYNQ